LIGLCEVVRVTHDDGVELTSDNIVNDSSLYAYMAVMCWIKPNRKNWFVSKNRIGIFFSESECSTNYVKEDCKTQWNYEIWFFQTGNGYISAVDWCMSTKFGL